MINYNIEKEISVTEFKVVLVKSTLSERRPVDDLDRLQKMIANGNLIITARNEDGELVGISRSVTDFAYCTYLSDLAVDLAYQKKGIGKELIRQTKLAAPQATLILLSAPEAVNYYPKIGMTQFTASFILRDIEALK